MLKTDAPTTSKPFVQSSANRARSCDGSAMWPSRLPRSPFLHWLPQLFRPNKPSQRINSITALR